MEKITKNPSKKPLRLILATEAFSSLANEFMQLLLPWYVLSATGSILWTGFVGCCSLVPNIFSSVWGARFIEKLGRSKAMLACEIIQLLLVGSIPALIMTDTAFPWLVGVLVFLSSVFDAPGELARTALWPTFSRYAGVPVSKTAGLVEAFDGMMTVAGPLLGGVVIACCGLLSAWIVCAALCLVIVILCVIVFTHRKPRQLRTVPSYKEVWNALRADPFLWTPVLFTVPTFILGQSWELVVLPSYIYGHGFTAAYLGGLGAAFGLGAFLGALAFASFSKRFTFFKLLTFNYLGYFLSVAVLYFELPACAVLGATALCGVPFGAFGAMITSIILIRTSPERRSKTLGMFAALTYGVESVCVLGLAAWIYWGGLTRVLEGLIFLFGALVLVSVWGRKKEDCWAILSSEPKKIFTK